MYTPALAETNYVPSKVGKTQFGGVTSHLGIGEYSIHHRTEVSYHPYDPAILKLYRRNRVLLGPSSAERAVSKEKSMYFSGIETCSSSLYAFTLQIQLSS